MSKSLFDMLGGQNPFSMIMPQLQEFQRTFKGNARDEIQKLLNSGQMSQSEFNQLQQQASQIMQFMGK